MSELFTHCDGYGHGAFYVDDAKSERQRLIVRCRYARACSRNTWSVTLASWMPFCRARQENE
jgi:hypothetical protein